MHGNGRRHAVVEHKAELSDGDHDLVCGKSVYTEPSHIECAEAEGGCFHAHLQHERGAQTERLAEVVAVDAGAAEFKGMCMVAFGEMEMLTLSSQILVDNSNDSEVVMVDYLLDTLRLGTLLVGGCFFIKDRKRIKVA